MGSGKRGGEGRNSRLEEGVRSVLSRWNGLQLAVHNQWGGSDSLQKSHHLASDLISSLSKSTEPVRLEDLENLLHESMLLTFNTDIEDGSIEEVAEQLAIIHEEYLHSQLSY
ncbi:pre-rRNA-processing protein TSR2 homolog [Neltuma alba]|uniref:pre-rRNA-processing protein TSR2 homolog n=1 Tax=Neltuma alba TaxID=207710 RepID=UPI0010A357D0|nr:pre-rRNA-processing protein TSR2 homolog [Prosopis alba]